jgi:hypothetical protein
MNDDPQVPAPPPRLVAAAISLGIDAVTAEVVQALHAAAIRSVLLKGPALVRALYADGADRPYGDIDLLVAPDDVPRAEQVLSELGFGPPPTIVHFSPRHAAGWRRGRLSVDLHHTFVGIDGPPADVWTALTHATALERYSLSTWRAAAALADGLRATPAFATGLRLLPAGERLATELGLPRGRPAEVVLRAQTPRPLARGFARLERTASFRGKAALLLREFIPEPEFMRRSSKVARRGPAGLAAAYLGRPLWLIWHAGPALRAWRRAKKDAQADS